jgi:cell division septation protein DedD
MIDAVVPSYRVPREPSGFPWRMLAMAGSLLGAMALGAGGWWAYQNLGATRGVPVVEADPRPFKVRPDDPGGLRVPNQDELILERPGQRNQAPAQAGRPAGLAPGAEAPDISALRAALAPPPPVVAPLPAVQSSPAAAPAPAALVAAPPPAAAPAAPAAQPVEVPAAAPAAQETRFGTTGRTQVQLGALVSDEAARSEWERLSRRAPELFQGRTPQIQRLDRGEGQAPLFRLRTGGLSDHDEATQFCEQVRAKGGACIPVRG